MHTRPLPLCLAAAVLLGAVTPAVAQPPPPPPDRVGRIAALTGAVSFHPAGASGWQLATRNLPITTGTGLWVALGGEATLGVAGDRVALAPSTQLELDALDDHALATTQAEGESYWHLGAVPAADIYTVRTPRGTVTIASPGRYEVASGDTGHPTSVTVLDGAATLTGLPVSQEIGAGQTLTVTGDGAGTPFAAAIGPAVEDDFLRRALAAEAPASLRPPAAPAIVGAMTGSDALFGVGDWAEDADFGPVWYPPALDYVPYRQGRWAFVAPWGWTWVDDAPWGFAPSHYGRWAQFGGRWGWVPGRDWPPGRRPVYAPALVGFLGGAALGLGRGPVVGWAPLGPRETYRPPYPVNERIVQTLNLPTGASIQFNGPVSFNRSAVTIVPAAILATSAPVAGAFRRTAFPAGEPAPVLNPRPDAMPTRATIGATRAVLQQVNPAGLSVPATHVAPGPSFGEAPRFGGLPHRPAPTVLPEERERGNPPPALRLTGGDVARPRPPAAPALVTGPHPPTLPQVRYGGPAQGERGLPNRMPQVRYLAAPHEGRHPAEAAQFRPAPPPVRPLGATRSPPQAAPPHREGRVEPRGR